MTFFTLILSPELAADEIWKRHQAELGPGRLYVSVNPSSSGPFFIGSHCPSALKHGIEVQLGHEITGDLNGLGYKIAIWEEKKP